MLLINICGQYLLILYDTKFDVPEFTDFRRYAT